MFLGVNRKFKFFRFLKENLNLKMHIFWRISSKNEKKGWSWKKMKSLFYEKPFIFTEKCKGEKVYDFLKKNSS